MTDLLFPGTVEEALQLLDAHQEDAKLLAGGQSLVPLINLRLASPRYIVSLGRIQGLSSIVRGADDSITIGALATHAHIEDSPVLKQGAFETIPAAASQIADVQVRSRGTIGGSLCHADPTADYAPVLMSLGASLKLVGPNGSRSVAIDDFFCGAFTTAVERNEILTQVEFDSLERWTHGRYLKFKYKVGGSSIVSLAIACRLDNGVCTSVHVAVGAVEATPLRLSDVENHLTGKLLTEPVIEEAAALARNAIREPLSDVHASADYRLHLVRVYIKRVLRSLIDLDVRPDQERKNATKV